MSYDLRIFLFVFFTTLASISHALPKIESIKSKIDIVSLSQLQVEEQIIFHVGIANERLDLERIYPTKLIDQAGRLFRIRYIIDELECDAGREDFYKSWIRPEQDSSYHLKVLITGERRKFSIGKHICVIRYRVNGNLRDEKVRDTIWFSTLGYYNPWSVANIETRFILPYGITQDKIEALAFAGNQKESKYDFKSTSNQFSELIFTNNRLLASGESLDIYLALPKGYLPSTFSVDLINFLLADYLLIILALISIFITLIYAVSCAPWFKRTATDLIDNFNDLNAAPSRLRYLIQAKSDMRLLSSALLNLAATGFIKIVDQEGRLYIYREASLEEQPIHADEVNLLALLPVKKLLLLDSKNNELLEIAGEFFESIKLGNILPSIIRDPGIKRKWLIFSVIQASLLAGTYIYAWSYLLQLVFASALLMLYHFSQRFYQQRELQALSTIGFILTLYSLNYQLILVQPLWILLFLVLIFLWLNIGIWFLFCYAPLRAYKDDLAQASNYIRYFNQVTHSDSSFGRVVTKEIFERFLAHAVALGYEQQWSGLLAGVLAKSTSQNVHNQSDNQYQNFKASWLISDRNFDFLGFSNTILAKIVNF